jgi:polyisoprenoid-binding protein YceI
MTMSLKHWQIDPTHSSITFLVRHMLVSRVRGTFTRWSGAIQFSEAVPAAGSATVSIDATSIDTQWPDRDAHLRSIDFLEATRHPLITFVATRVESIDAGMPSGTRQLMVGGELTIRGVTREVTLDVGYGGRMRDPWGRQRVGFSARTTISRKDFGITFNQPLACGGFVIGDKLDILIEVEAVEAAVAERATTTPASNAAAEP